MADNSVGEVDECLPDGSRVVCIQFGQLLVSIIQNMEVSTFQRAVMYVLCKMEIQSTNFDKVSTIENVH